MDHQSVDLQCDSREEDLELAEKIVDEGLLFENADIEVPFVGMIFESVVNAKLYYNAYARRNGFSTRTRRTTKNDMGLIRSAKFVCGKEGQYEKKVTPQKRRENKRCGCEAEFYVQLTEGKFVLTKFVKEHNHETEPPDRVHLLRSQREITDTQALLMKQMLSAGINKSKIRSFFTYVAGGAQNLNFTAVDCNNFLQRTRKNFLKEGDVKCLNEWFRQKKRENKHFFKKFWKDDSGAVRGVFFCDAKSRRDYGLFGDAICFDTTFKTNNYNMVCAPLVGVNHHWQTTLFGCGLLEGETSEAVAWLLTTFLEAMGGKAPKTIFTDQSKAIANAIESVLPETHHRLCLWHIYQNAAKKLASTLAKFKNFAPEFKRCVYEPETPSEFEEMWAAMLVRFELETDAYCQKLYTIKEKWSLAYGRAHFCAGMTTTQRSESANKFLKEYFGSTTILREFVEQYTKAMNDRREKERVEESRTRQSDPILIGTWKVLSEASTVYSKKLFYMFQDEYKKLIDLKFHQVSCEETNNTYSVQEFDGLARAHIVTYDIAENFVSCSCKKFEWQGILCCHALKVFRELSIQSLPSKYYLKRWSREIANEIVFDSFGEPIPNDIDPTVAVRYSELSHISHTIVAMSATSTPRYLVAKKLLLEAQEKLAAIDISDAECGNTLRGAVTNEDGNSSADEPLLDPKGKRKRGEQKKRKRNVLEAKRKKAPSTKNTEVITEKNVVTSDPIIATQESQNVSGQLFASSESILLPNLNETHQNSFSSMLGVNLYDNSWQGAPFIPTQEKQNVARQLFTSSFRDSNIGQYNTICQQTSGNECGSSSHVSPFDQCVDKIMEFGFPRDSVIQALIFFKGNVDQAVTFLFDLVHNSK